MIRLFVGIALPESVRLRLGGLCSGVPGARWVPPENLHLTLRFIGEVEIPLAEECDAALAEIRAPAFDLALSRVGWFESRQRAHTLWVGVDSNPQLVRLRDKVESTLVRTGLAPERRKFSPHVTLARLKGRGGGHLLDWLAGNGMFRADPFPVTGFTLFSSHLGHGGAVYREEAFYPIG